jgi:hypothetical protein
MSGAPWNGRVTPYLVTDTNAMYVGDVVIHGGTAGAAGAFVYGQSVEGMPVITRATDGTGTVEIPVGVVVGFLPLQPLQDVNYKPADGTDRIALVCDDPTVIFEAQEDADTTPIAASSIGMNIAFSVTAGSTLTGESGMELDSSTANTTTTLPLRVLGLVKRVDNTLNTAGSGDDEGKFLVYFNAHRYKGAAGI